MAYRHTERVEEQLQDKRNRILQAVRQVVGEVGFHGAQVTTVAEAAGVATGTVYRYFPSKGELFAEALALNAQHEFDVVAAVAQADGSAASRLADALRVFAGRAVRARRLAWAMIAEPAEPEVDAARLTYRRAFAEVFEKLIRAGISSGEFPAQNAAASAACVMGALSEGLIGPLAPEAPDLADNRALVEAIVCFCLQAVAASRCPSSPGPSSPRTRSFRVVESKR
jgi:AcrR family transcriptional regulator